MTYEQMIQKILSIACQRYELPMIVSPLQISEDQPYYCSDRLCFYPIKIQHIPKLHQWFNDPQIAQYMADPDTPITESQLITDFVLINRYDSISLNEKHGSQRTPIELEGIYLFVEERKSGSAIGYCAIYDISQWNQRAEISFLIGDPSYHHQGYGTEIIQSLIHIAFMHLNLIRIEATATEQNIASWKALEKAGFRKVGRQTHAHRLHGQYMDDFLYEYIREP